MPAFTFVASASAARYVGAEPVLCDVRSAARLQHRSRRTWPAASPRAPARSSAVHFCGYPARRARAARAVRRARARADRGLRPGDRRARRRRPGARSGTVGELGAFSFFSKKQLCVGEGGMVTTADEQLAERVRLLRSHALTSSTWDRHRGHDPAYDVIDIGFNYRLDEPRAALGLSRLARLDERHRQAARDRSRLPRAAGRGAGHRAALRRSGGRALLALRLPGAARRPPRRRDRFRDELKANGIQTTWYPALHSFTEYRQLAPAGRASGGDRGRRPPLRAAAQLDHGRGRGRDRRRGRARRAVSSAESGSRAGSAGRARDSNSSWACS